MKHSARATLLSELDDDLIYEEALPTSDSQLRFQARISGLYRSSDAGASWTSALASLRLSAPLPITAVAVSPNFAVEPIVLAGTTGAILHSGDGANTWRVFRLPEPAPVISGLAFSPAFLDDRIAFATTAEDGVFISSDGGSSWQVWNFGLLDGHVLCLAVSPAFAKDRTVYCGTETGVFRSTNAGKSWTFVDVPDLSEAVVRITINDELEMEAESGTIHRRNL